MPRRPEQPPRTEVPLFPFLLASRFDSRETSQAPYDTLQAIVREQQTLADFSVFRLIQNWPESISKAPPSPKRWYVVVLGETRKNQREFVAHGQLLEEYHMELGVFLCC